MNTEPTPREPWRRRVFNILVKVLAPEPRHPMRWPRYTYWVGRRK